MSLRERAYRVLVVSAERQSAALTALLPKPVCDPVETVFSVSAGKRAAAERAFDFVVINSPLPDGTGLRFAIDLCSSGETVALVLVKSELYGDVYGKVAEYGVFTLPKPLSRSVLAQALDWMGSARERLRRYEQRTLSIEEKMQEIRLVNRAKWLLVSELFMSEPEAHRYIEKQAMDRCLPKRSVAEEILKTYS